MICENYSKHIFKRHVNALGVRNNHLQSKADRMSFIVKESSTRELLFWTLKQMTYLFYILENIM